jgi:signal transduction histidine kinase
MKSAAANRRGFGLTGKLFLALTALLVILLASTVLLSYVSYLNARRVYAERFAVDRTSIDASELYVLIQRELVLSRALATFPVTRRYFSDPSDEVSEASFREVAESVRGISTGNLLFFAPAATRAIYINGPEFEYSDSPRYFLQPGEPADSWFFSLLYDFSKAYELNLDTNRELANSTIWINMPVEGVDRRLGVLGTTVRLEDFAEKYSADSLPGLVPMIINESGVIIAHPDNRIIGHNANADLPGDRIIITDLVDIEGSLGMTLETLRRSAGEITILDGIDGGEPVILAMRYVPELRWYLVSEIVLDNVPLPISQLVTRLLIMFSVSLVMFYSVITMTIGRIVLRPLGNLQSLALQAAEGDYAVSFPSGADEIGMLGSSLTVLIDQIRRHTGGLEEIISKRTEELRRAQENIVENRQAAAIGRLIMGLSHTINTPLGNALTSADSISYSIKDLKGEMAENALTKQRFADLTEKIGGLNELVLGDLHQIIAFLNVLKSVNLDMRAMDVSRIDIRAEIETIVERLLSAQNAAGVHPSIEISEDLEIFSFEEPLEEVLSILLSQSLVHGGDYRGERSMTIRAFPEEGEAPAIRIELLDNALKYTETEIRDILNPISLEGIGKMYADDFRVELYRANLIIRALLQGSLSIESAPETKDSQMMLIRLPRTIVNL